ncbi:MAG: DUF1800 family protein [Candidatus Limnocylindrales bacterium]
MATPTTKALIAHLLRRTGFGPFPGQVKALVPLGIDGAIDHVLAALPVPDGAPPDLSDDSSWAPVKWCLSKMGDPRAGLHEKMTWFFHGLVTISHDKVFWWQVEWPAYMILRQNALGSYRTLLRQVTIQPAMLLYLDGDWSTVDGPNENYSRELQELFSIGQENVTQENVLNGALALAGWHVDWEAATSVFIDERWASLASDQKVSFLGKQVYRYDGVVDAACDHPQMPAFIADKAWRYLVGTIPSATKLASLASTYRQTGLDNRALVEAIVRDPAFLKKRMTRPRYPVEWVTAALGAAGLQDDPDLAADTLWQMGQLPFYPPSVAGWPTGNRWLSPSLALARAALATDSPAIASIVDASNPIATALDRCSLYEVSAQTRLALSQASGSLVNASERAAVLLGLCLSSPEFALA